MKKNLMTIAFAVAATAVFAQDKPAAAPAQTPPPAPSGIVIEDADPVIVGAGDVKIRKSEFEAAIRTLPAEYQQFAMGTGKKQFAEDFLRMKLLAGEASKTIWRTIRTSSSSST